MSGLFVNGSLASSLFCNETWLNGDINNNELLHSEYAIYRKDRINRTGGGVLLAMKSASFTSIKEYIPADMDIVCAEIVTTCKQKVLPVSCYRPLDVDINWVIKFHKFLDLANDLYDNMVISGDLNFPNIPWDSLSSVRDIMQEAFLDMLNDHYLSQVNRLYTRGRNVLDLIITNIPDQIIHLETLSPVQSGIFTDHCVLLFEFAAFVKSSKRIHRTVYDYNQGDFDGLRNAVRAVELTSLLGSENINIDWQNWKDAFLAAVSDYIPTKKLKGANPLPWINSEILNIIKRKQFEKSLRSHHQVT